MRFFITALLAFAASVSAQSTTAAASSSSKQTSSKTSSSGTPAVTGNYNVCQSNYKACIGNSIDATACGCILSSCMGEDTTHDGGICASATATFVVSTAAPAATAAAGSSVVAGSGVTTSRTASATGAMATGAAGITTPAFGLLGLGLLALL